MDQQRNDGDAGAANPSIPGDASDAKDPLATPTESAGVADVAAAISDKITYSVTVEEAQERFAHARRKVPSLRSLQRYCQEGLVKGLRTAVTYDDGSHAEPWFINDASLDAYIKKQPIVVLGDASDANAELAAPSREVGGAKMMNSTAVGVASVATLDTENGGAARPSAPKDEPAGISLSDVLLENARLQERLEGKTEVIKLMEVSHERQLQDLRSERDFLRTDVSETRALARDFKAVADNILGTFKQIGTKQGEPAEKVEPSSILYKPVQPNGQQAGESRPLQ